MYFEDFLWFAYGLWCITCIIFEDCYLLILVLINKIISDSVLHKYFIMMIKMKKYNKK